MYLSIVLRSNIDITLLEVIVKFLWSAQMKLAIISDLILLRTLLILATYILDIAINLFEFIKFIGTKTYFLEGLFVIILNLGFFFFSIDHLLYLFNLLSWEVWKHFLDLHYILDISWECLDIRLTILSVHLFDWVFSSIFVILQHC